MKKHLKFWLAGFMLLLALSFTAPEANAQCAMCRSSVESSHSDHNKLSRFGSGLNKGILYLMAIPYILGGTIGFLWYRSSRRKG